MVFILWITFINFIWICSQLARIESDAFLNSSLQSIAVPRNVQFIDGSAFLVVRLSSILNHKLIHYVSPLSNITIPAHIAILGSYCFEYSESLSSISFESPFQLKRIESRAFSTLNFEIVIPSMILFIALDAFDSPFQINFEDCNSCSAFNYWLELRTKVSPLFSNGFWSLIRILQIWGSILW
jgi:hypothetical protein